MTRSRRKNFPLIKAGIILFLVLLALYIPLKVYIAVTEKGQPAGEEETALSIFVTNELYGYWMPCG